MKNQREGIGGLGGIILHEINNSRFASKIIYLNINYNISETKTKLKLLRYYVMELLKILIKHQILKTGINL